MSPREHEGAPPLLPATARISTSEIIVAVDLSTMPPDRRKRLMDGWHDFAAKWGKDLRFEPPREIRIH